MTAEPVPTAGSPLDPDDPAGTYAVDPALARRLTRRVVAGPRARRTTTTAPFTGGPLAELPLSSEADVAAAVDGARAAQRGWAELPPARRAAVLLRLHDLLLDRQAEGLDLVQWESGKARRHAFEEVGDIATTARHYGRAAARYLRGRRAGGFLPLLHPARVHLHPRGVVGIVSPWNYPLSLPVGDALPALVAGNAVVLKPGTQSALTALWAASLVEEAGLPEGVLQVVLDDGPVVGRALVDRSDHIAFTGSTRTGREVAARAGERLVGASLELGGKNAMVVCADADLDRAAEGAVRGCFASAGQLCVSTERLLLHASVHDAFLGRFLGRVRALRLGVGLGWEIDMGSLVSQRRLDAVTAHVADARAKGATVLHGGRARPDLGPFVFEPTVLAGVTPGMAAYDEETFGPVVAVSAFSDDDDAVRRANATDYGLNASVWTRDVARGRAIARRLRAGTVNVNEAYAAAWSAVGAPMGGMGSSGLGRRHGAEGILRFTEPQTVAVARLVGFGTPDGVGDEAYARLLTVAMRAMKRAHRR